MRDVRKSRLAMFGGLLAAGLVLAACGGSSTHSATPNTAASTTPTTSSTTGAGARGRFDLTAFRTCMSGYGITIAQTPRNSNRTPRSTTPGETRPAGGGGFGFGLGGGNFANRFNTPPAGVDPAKYKTALAACRSKLPAAGANPLINSSAFAAYRSCLKDHGVTLPTAGTTPTTAASGTNQPGAINRNDPKVQAALKTCQPLLPAGGFGRNATTTTTAPQA